MPLSGGGSGSPATVPRPMPPAWAWRASEHALLGAVVELPASGGVVLTGRLSPSAQGWLADHAVGGVVLFPGAGFVELAIRAGDEVGCGVVDELNLAAPLVLPAGGSVAVQVVVGGPDDSGARAVSVFSRGRRGVRLVAARRGRAERGVGRSRAADLSVWPPVGAVPVDVGDGYERLAERGYGYGPAFRGLTSMWRRGDEVFAEVTLPGGRRGIGGRVRGSPGDAGRGAARGDPGAPMTDGAARRGLGAGAVLLAAGVVARRGRGGGARADRAGGPVGGVDRTGRRVGAAGAVGGVDGGPPGDRSAAAGRGVEFGAGPALRGRLVGPAVSRVQPVSVSAWGATELEDAEVEDRRCCSSRHRWPATS